MRRLVRILFSFTFALVLSTRANVFAQERTGLDDPRFSTTGPQVLSAFLNSCVSDSLHWGNDYLLAGSASDRIYVASFIQAHPGRQVILTEDGSLAKEKITAPLVLKLAPIVRHLDMTETSNGLVVRTGSMVFSLTALAGMQPPRYFTATESIFRDTIAAHTSAAPHEEKPKTFWESTVEPILVTIGAAAIIALFFIIRS